MGEEQAVQLAQSVGSLLHVEHIAQLHQQASPERHLVRQSLAQMVEITEPVYYAYILQNHNGTISITADSSAADSDTSFSTKRSCSESIEINSKPLIPVKVLLLADSNPYGNWIRALVPIFDSDKNVVAVLGLCYSASGGMRICWKDDSRYINGSLSCSARYYFI